MAPFLGRMRFSRTTATIDPDGELLYLALEGAAKTGDYDWPPLIVAFSIAR
jgi:hypothetical protein